LKANCVGLKNHRSFVIFLIWSLLAVSFFLAEAFSYFSRCQELIVKLNGAREEYDQLSLPYYLLASQKAIRVTTLVILTVFFSLMLVFLLMFQLKVLSLGFTSQFPPPPMYQKLSANLKTWSSATIHRLKNFYIFFFKSPEQNMNLYNIYKAEHSKLMAIHKPKVPYPLEEKENKKESDYKALGKMSKIFGPIIPNTSNNGSNSNQFDIDLD
jgi:hypothetical protein